MNPQEEQEYQERMGSPEMEYLQHQTDFPEQHPHMTTLNTIIEEEKKEFDERFVSADVTGSECWNISGRNIHEVREYTASAMQRAYEAGANDFRSLISPQTYEWDGGEQEWSEHLTQLKKEIKDITKEI